MLSMPGIDEDAAVLSPIAFFVIPNLFKFWLDWRVWGFIVRRVLAGNFRL
jgi:hypothetical protein